MQKFCILMVNRIEIWDTIFRKEVYDHIFMTYDKKRGMTQKNRPFESPSEPSRLREDILSTKFNVVFCDEVKKSIVIFTRDH
ncbi:hypothetical protein PIPA1_10460 [Pelosinus sp. IPA-1]|nr:hypothetical protein PIPA1_10460 [Pelosinus sp. IPA-1]